MPLQSLVKSITSRMYRKKTPTPMRDSEIEARINALKKKRSEEKKQELPIPPYEPTQLMQK